jgi:hypothetical protein
MSKFLLLYYSSYANELAGSRYQGRRIAEVADKLHG